MIAIERNRFIFAKVIFLLKQLEQSSTSPRKRVGSGEKTLLQQLTDIFRVCVVEGGCGIIVQSKFQVTPTQVESELKLGCANNISVDMFGCSFSYI